MPRYHFVILDRLNKATGADHTEIYSNDAAAILAGVKVVEQNMHGLEIWRGEKLVIELKWTGIAFPPSLRKK